MSVRETEADNAPFRWLSGWLTVRALLCVAPKSSTSAGCTGPCPVVSTGSVSVGGTEISCHQVTDRAKTQ